MIQPYAYFEGQIVKSEDAKINVMTHAFLYGTAVFEGIRAYWNEEKKKIYLLKAKEHYERLLRSCKILRMKPDLSVQEMLDITIELIKKNAPTSDTYIRPCWYKSSYRIGPGLIAKDPKEFPNEDKFLISAIDLGDYLDTEKGLSVNVSNWRRLSDNAIPARAKVSGSYVNTALAKASSSIAGYDDSIFLTEAGKVSEGSAMNLFIIRDGRLVTSGITENILEGITRDMVISIARDEGIETEIRQIDRTELYIADEAFFVGTGAQIAPIGKVDDYEIGNTKAGSITKKLQKLYFDVVRGNNPNYADALIEI